MGLQPSEARNLSLHDYQGMLHCWELAHATEQEPAELSDKDAESLWGEAEAIDWDALTPEAE